MMRGCNKKGVHAGVLVVRGYQIRCADIGWVTGRNVLYFWLAEELM